MLPLPSRRKALQMGKKRDHKGKEQDFGQFLKLWSHCTHNDKNLVNPENRQRMSDFGMQELREGRDGLIIKAALAESSGVTGGFTVPPVFSNQLLIKFRNDTTDSITVFNDLTSNAWGVSSGITELQFSDGSSVNLGRPSSGQGAPLTFTWLGSSNSSITGSSYGANVFELGGGSESFTGGGTANGGSGNNTYLASSATGQTTISANAAGSKWPMRSRYRLPGRGPPAIVAS